MNRYGALSPVNITLSLTVGIFLTVGVSGASAGVIRDDRGDELYTALANDPVYQSVGQIVGQSSSSGYYASASVISNNWVLTAAHVVDDATSLSFNIGGASYDAVSWTAHSGWDGNLGKGYDIGLIEFGVDFVSMGVDPALLYTGASEVGSISTAVGYGTTGTGATGYTTFDQKKRAGENVIDTLLRTPGKSNRVLLTDFDNTDDPGDSSWGSSDPLELEYLISPGDSGGGLFIDDGTGTYLAGVHSFGWGIIDGNPDSDYGDAAGHTRVSSFTDWIYDTINGVSSGGGGGGGGKPSGVGGGKKNNDWNSSNIAAATVENVPEPGALALLAVGLLGLTTIRKNRGTRI